LATISVDKRTEVSLSKFLFHTLVLPHTTKGGQNLRFGHSRTVLGVTRFAGVAGVSEAPFWSRPLGRLCLTHDSNSALERSRARKTCSVRTRGAPVALLSQIGGECRERRKGAFLPSPWYASTPPCSPCSAHAAESREKTARNRRKNHTHWYVPVQLLGCLKRAYFWLPREEPSSIAQRENFIDRKEVRFPIWKAYSALTPGQGLCPQASRHTTRNTQLAISTAQQSYSSPQREIFSLSEKGFYKSINTECVQYASEKSTRFRLRPFGQ